MLKIFIQFLAICIQVHDDNHKSMWNGELELKCVSAFTDLTSQQYSSMFTQDYEYVSGTNVSKLTKLSCG